MRRLLAGLLAGLLLCAAAPAPIDPCAPSPAAWVAMAVRAAAAPIIPVPAIDGRGAAALCRRDPQALLCAGGKGGDTLSLARVQAVDAELRAKYRYKSDEETYGVDDYWTHDVLCGDCEDYALTLADRLHAAGERSAAMSLMLWQPSLGVGHATLLVDTADRGVVEAGVGPGGEPQAVDWSAGTRIAFMALDGRRHWTILKPGLLSH